jgi:hypothetical protein
MAGKPTTLREAIDRAATAQRDVIEAARRAGADARAARESAPAAPAPATPKRGR